VEENTDKVNSRIELEIQEARSDLLQATSAAAAAEATVTSLRSDIEELHRESKTFQEWLNNSRDSISEEQQVDAAPLISTSSIGFDDMTTATISALIPNGYRGLDWDSIWVVHHSRRVLDINMELCHRWLRGF